MSNTIVLKILFPLNNNSLDIKPNPGSQELFLKLLVYFLIYGGARGGGKTWALLLEALYHIHNPGFTAVIFRRTYPQILAAGGLWDTSCELYPLVGGKPNKSSLKWTFPSGATVSFRHLFKEEDKYNWQGSSVCYLGFDEVTQFTYTQFMFLVSCNRSMCGIDPFIRATCNPDSTSWVRNLLDPYLLEDGYSNPLMSGVVKSLQIDDGNFYFPDVDCEQNVHNSQRSRLMTFSYISADVWDNPALLQNSPNYLLALESLPKVQRERFLGKRGYGGNWNIKPTGGKIFSSDWFNIIYSSQVPQFKNIVRFWDLSSGRAIKDGDWTVGIKMGIALDASGLSTFYVLDIQRFRHPPALANQMISAIAKSDGVHVKVRWEIEPGSSGVRDSSTIQSYLSGFDARGIRSSLSKYTRWSIASSPVESGNVFLIDAQWNKTFLSELEDLPTGDHDDQADAFSSAYLFLSSPSGISSSKYDY